MEIIVLLLAFIYSYDLLSYSCRLTKLVAAIGRFSPNLTRMKNEEDRTSIFDGNGLHGVG